MKKNTTTLIANKTKISNSLYKPYSGHTIFNYSTFNGASGCCCGAFSRGRQYGPRNLRLCSLMLPSALFLLRGRTGSPPLRLARYWKTGYQNGTENLLWIDRFFLPNVLSVSYSFLSSIFTLRKKIRFPTCLKTKLLIRVSGQKYYSSEVRLQSNCNQLPFFSYSTTYHLDSIRTESITGIRSCRQKQHLS